MKEGKNVIQGVSLIDPLPLSLSRWSSDRLISLFLFPVSLQDALEAASNRCNGGYLFASSQVGSCSPAAAAAVAGDRVSNQCGCCFSSIAALIERRRPKAVAMRSKLRAGGWRESHMQHVIECEKRKVETRKSADDVCSRVLGFP